MKAKALEIRDKGTFIPALAVSMSPENGGQAYLLRRAGFGAERVPALIMLTFLTGNRHAEFDPYAWCDRTMKTAHAYIEANWNDLEDGSVICVETILGERAVPKVSERFEDNVF